MGAEDRGSRIMAKEHKHPKNWRSQNFDLLGLKNLSTCQLWEAPAQEDIIEF